MNPFLLGILIVKSLIFNIGYLYAIYGNIFLQSPKYKYPHKRWMANLNAKTQLKDIVFPGSHDSLIFEPITFKQKYTDMAKVCRLDKKVSVAVFNVPSFRKAVSLPIATAGWRSQVGIFSLVPFFIAESWFPDRLWAGTDNAVCSNDFQFAEISRIQKSEWH